MSVTENLQSHQEEIGMEAGHVYELLNKTATGRKTIEASEAMNKTGRMQALMAILGEESVPVEEREATIKYFSKIMQLEPVFGMKLFAGAMYDVAAVSTAVERVTYYLVVCEVAIELAKTPEYLAYIAANQNFEKDNSVEAVTARAAVKSIQGKLKIWSII